jgi:predicted transporter
MDNSLTLSKLVSYRKCYVLFTFANILLPQYLKAHNMEPNAWTLFLPNTNKILFTIFTTVTSMTDLHFERMNVRQSLIDMDGKRSGSNSLVQRIAVTSSVTIFSRNI